GKRAYGPDIKTQEEPKALDSFYIPFQKQVAAARDVIKEAVANRERNRDELGQRTTAQAEASPIVSRMGGVEKISEMSGEEQATKETATVMAGQNELGNIMLRMRAGDAEFANKDKAILAAPGGHDQIAKEIGARIEKLPVIGHSEAGDIVDPIKLQALERERA